MAESESIKPEPRQLSPVEGLNLALFQTMIAQRKDLEVAEGKTIHLERVDPEELSFKDYEMYSRIVLSIGEEVSIENFNAYQDVAQRENQSRSAFSAYLANVLTGKQKVPDFSEKHD